MCVCTCAGVMVGRAVTDNPYYWRHLDTLISSSNADTHAGPAATDTTCGDIHTSVAASASASGSGGVSRRDVLRKYAEYANCIQSRHPHPSVPGLLVKPLLTLFHSQCNSKAFKRLLTERLQQERRESGSGGKCRQGRSVLVGDIINSAVKESGVELDAV